MFWVRLPIPPMFNDPTVEFLGMECIYEGHRVG
jgi:hypothetical protein